MNSSPLLEMKQVTMKFGGLYAVKDCSFKIFPNDLVGLIGPNGAGKTTAFNIITGVYQPTQGDVLLNGKNLVGNSMVEITQNGVCRTFQNIRLFQDMTVFDNVRLAGHSQTNYGILSSIFRSRHFHEEEKKLNENTAKFLEIFNLTEHKDELAKNLPYGKQRRLEIARALATKPKILLLDEPAAGMNPKETAELTDLIKWLRNHFKIAILLIEHDMSLVMKMCERIYVLDYGKIIAYGNPEEIKSNPKVIEAYLGKNEEVINPPPPLSIEENPLLKIKEMNVHYNAIHALKGANLKVYPKEIVSILGANGAGKTTMLKTISGILPMSSGTINFQGKKIHHLPAHARVASGIAQSPEGRMIFPNMTVQENLEMGAYLRRDSKEIAKDEEFCFALFPRLKERLNQLAGTLSGGEQQMLAISRAYMSKPIILLLDEPSLGIAPVLVDAIFKAIEEINKQGMTILLVEQNAKKALSIAHRGYVLTNGQVVLEGNSKELLTNKEVQQAYLGH